MNELPDFAKTSRLLSRKQTMELLDVSSTFLWSLMNHKDLKYRLPFYKMSPKCVKFKFDEVMYWLEKRKS